MRSTKTSTNYEAERALIREAGGCLRMSDALRMGISRRALYQMRDLGLIQPLSRGLYRLSELPDLAEPDLVVATRRIQEGVLCLISALAFHGLTTQVPHEIQIAIDRQRRSPAQIDYPPVRIFRFSGAAYSEGVETSIVDGMPIKVYSPEKTVADCFKFRLKLGVDVAVEALKLWWKRPNRDVGALSRYARICGVERIIRPYLEALQ